MKGKNTHRMGGSMARGKAPAPAGYSGTPLVRKLGIKPGHRFLLVDAPPGYEAVLGALPPAVRVLRSAGRPVDVVQWFVRDRARLEARFGRHKALLESDGMLWVSWPKKASGIGSDVDGNVVRTVGLANGLVAVKVAAVDETWSGLKFVYRTQDRPSVAR